MEQVQGISLRRTGRLGVITIERPQKRNAMTQAMLLAFLDGVAEFAADDAVTAIVVAGSGGAFCAGADLKELESLPAERRRVLRDRGDGPRERWPLLMCGKPTVAAIEGPAIGMGVEIALQCDVRFVCPEASLAWNFVTRGLVPDMGVSTWLLPRLVGLNTAFDLLYSGRTLSGTEAAELGLATLTPDPAALLSRAMTAAATFAAQPPLAVAATKALLLGSLERGMAEHLTAHDEAMNACIAGAEFQVRLSDPTRTGHVEVG